MLRFASPTIGLLLAVRLLPAVGLFFSWPGPASAEPPTALVDTFSVAEVARTARSVEIGGSLRVEGLVLDGTVEALHLERFQVFTPDARLVVHREGGAADHLPVPDNAYFRGGVVGRPGSLALLSVREGGGVRGIVRRDGRLYLMVEEPPPTGIGAPALAGLPAAPEAPAEPFACSAGELQAPVYPLQPPVGGGDTAALGEKALADAYTARVAIETDWEFFQRFGNETDATDYVGDLIAYASGIYDQEITTDLQVAHLSLWDTSTDPWEQEDSPTCALFEFGRFWNDHRTGVDRTIAHMMSGKSTGGGVAWLGVLCSNGFLTNHGGNCPDLAPQIDNYGGDYGYTGSIDGNFDPDNPSVVWDVYAVSHEIGHNFDSPHTHCYENLGGSSEPVDECYGSEPDCYSGPTSLPCPDGNSGCGTLMSYCHIQPGTLSNISLTFGTGHPWGELPQRVPDQMLAHVESVASSSTCLDRVSACEEVVLTGETVSDTRTYEACGTIRAGDGFEVVEPGDVTFRGSKAILESGFSVGSGASITVEIQ